MKASSRIFFAIVGSVALHHMTVAASLAEGRSEAREEFARAIALARQGQIPEARRVCARSILLGSGQREEHIARFALAAFLQHEGQQEAAFRELQRVVDYAPTLHEKAQNQQMKICIALLSPESADGMHPGRPSAGQMIDMLEQMLFSNPTAERTACVHYHLGLFYEQAGRHELAELHYDRAAKKDPGDEWYTRAFFSMARILYHRSRSAPRDMSLAIEARDFLERYLAESTATIHPEAANRMIEDITGRIQESAFQQARFYDKTLFPLETRLTAYRNFLSEYPDAEQAEHAAQRIAWLQHEHP